MTSYFHAISNNHVQLKLDSKNLEQAEFIRALNALIDNRETESQWKLIDAWLGVWGQRNLYF